MNREVERLDACGAVEIPLFFNPLDVYMGLLGKK